MVLKPKLLTPRLSQRRAIYSLNMSTLTPFRLRVARVNQSHIHPSAEVRRVRLTNLFVGDECLKSGKTPSKQSVALNLSPLGTTNAGVSETARSPVFKYQYTTTKRPSQALTQQMVTVFSKASLSAQQLFQMNLGRFRAFRLPSPVQLKGFVFYSLLMVRIILATLAADSRGNNTQNSHHNLSPCSRSFNLQDNVQPPLPFVSQQVGAGVFLFLLLTSVPIPPYPLIGCGFPVTQ